jgi:hypothetical protein
MSIETELGTLIRRLNPYTEGKPGRMRFVPANPAVDALAKKLAVDAEAEKRAVDAEAEQLDQLDLTHIQLEVEGNYTKSGNYAAQWIFKGQAQNIVKAMRIRYHYRVEGSGGKIWATDYLLVGYEGSPGS